MSNIKVALIEDDKDIVSMYTQYFALTGGFDVSAANDGATGLALVAKIKPDVVLLDMMMPTMSGIEALTKLRALPNRNSFKVIALTNMNDPDTTAKLHQLGADDFLVKANTPVAQLGSHIRSVLDR